MLSGFMKKCAVISLFFMLCCQGAANGPESSWNRAIQQHKPIERAVFLRLKNKQIEAIPANLSLSELRSLDLGDNQLRTIPATVNLPVLRSLGLSNNEIVFISPHLNFPHLEELDLDNNQIKDIDLEVLQQFPRLKTLSLEKNPITQDRVNEIRQAFPDLTIYADDTGPQYDKGPQYRLGASVRGLQSK